MNVLVAPYVAFFDGHAAGTNLVTDSPPPSTTLHTTWPDITEFSFAHDSPEMAVAISQLGERSQRARLDNSVLKGRTLLGASWSLEHVGFFFDQGVQLEVFHEFGRVEWRVHQNSAPSTVPVEPALIDIGLCHEGTLRCWRAGALLAQRRGVTCSGVQPGKVWLRVRFEQYDPLWFWLLRDASDGRKVLYWTDEGSN